ncbi:MAG: hypothetical protein ACJAYA_000754 [Bacteroidia bacterium]|jgi:hypothetical protein
MRRKLFAALTLAWIVSVSSVFAQDAVGTQPEQVKSVDQKVSESPEQLKLRIEEYEIAIEPLKSTSTSEITGGSNYEAKKLYLDEMIAEWEGLTKQKWESRFKK